MLVLVVVVMVHLSVMLVMVMAGVMAHRELTAGSGRGVARGSRRADDRSCRMHLRHLLALNLFKLRALVLEPNLNNTDAQVGLLC